MEYTTEIINISKIKEGFYIGDKGAGLNLQVLFQFKITHIINTSGIKVINSLETSYIKYLTLNWAENINQSLFDSKDEIANKITNFIDDSLLNGEGLLAFSAKGQNRVCIVVIIYLIKKYRWGLMKCIDFLHSKKPDVNIPKYFLSQLSKFEMRLTKIGQGPISLNWTDDQINDGDEKVMRNTYVNGQLYKEGNIKNAKASSCKHKPKIGWGDTNPYFKGDSLIHQNMKKDLILQKDIKPITSHLRLKPSKSCIKGMTNNINDDHSSNNTNTNSNSNNNSPTPFKKANLINYTGLKGNNSNDNSNDFNTKQMTLNSNNISTNAPFIDNTIKSNIHIEKSSDVYNKINEEIVETRNTIYERNNNYNNHNMNIVKDLIHSSEQLNNNSNNIKATNTKEYLMSRDYKKINENNRNSYTNNANKKTMTNNFLLVNNIPLSMNNENSSKNCDDKILQNNFIKDTNADFNRRFKVIDNNSNQNPIQISRDSYQRKLIFNENNNMNNYQPKILPFRGDNNKSPHSLNLNNKPLNNFDPSLMKKNQNMFNRPNSGSNKGPVKLPKDIIYKKPSTPDHIIYYNLKGFQNHNLVNNYGPLQRSSSKNMKKKNDANNNNPLMIRPATAPQKDKAQKMINKHNYIHSTNPPNFIAHNSLSGLKRLPSPMIYSNNNNNTLYKSLNNPERFRIPSPMLKSSNLYLSPYFNGHIIK